MDRLESEFAGFLESLRQDAVARDVAGCSLSEILELENRCGVRVPRAYRLYLQAMGHSADRLFNHDHYAVTYAHVLRLGDQLRAAMTDPCPQGAPSFVLPPSAFVIVGRLDEQFLYILCDSPEDSAVFYVNTWDRAAKQQYPSVLAWLRDMHTEAVDAIRRGYYVEHPNGTMP